MQRLVCLALLCGDTFVGSPRLWLEGLQVSRIVPYVESGLGRGKRGGNLKRSEEWTDRGNHLMRGLPITSWNARKVHSRARLTKDCS